MSFNVSYFDLVLYSSMVLTGPEVAIVSIILECSDVCGIWYRVMASLLDKIRSSCT